MHRITQLPDRFLVGQLNLRGIQSHRIHTSAGTIHVLDGPGRGSLPPVLFFHGFSAAAHYYDGMMLRMRPYARRVTAPDLLGHGLSEMPRGGLDHTRVRRAMLAAVDRVVKEPCIVFGNSLGGAAALKLAIDRPELVKGLFLVAPGGAPMEREELGTFKDRFRLRTHEQALDFVDRLFAKRHPMRHVLAWGTRHQFARPGLRDLIERVGPDDLLKGSDISQLQMPIEVIWGAHDRILEQSSLEFYRKSLPAHAKLEVVPHFGHTPHMDCPAEPHERLLAFAKRVEHGAVSAERRRRAPAGVVRSAERPDLPLNSASPAP